MELLPFGLYSFLQVVTGFKRQYFSPQKETANCSSGIHCGLLFEVLRDAILLEGCYIMLVVCVCGSPIATVSHCGSLDTLGQTKHLYPLSFTEIFCCLGIG